MVMLSATVHKEFWKSKKVFLTGHTGFKGSWMSLWLQSMGAIVKGYSLDPNTSPNLFTVAGVGLDMESDFGDIRELDRISKSMLEFNPDVLFHMAAQPLVRYSYMNPIETYSTNIMGTVNVLESARKCSNLKAIVCITSDKCYENTEVKIGYCELDPMGGYDPYSSSKGCAELVISAYRRSYFNSESTAALASARAGNVIGGGDWSDDRLIPDILRAFEKSEKVVIRNPLATRPWQHVLEPISGYLVLAQKLYSNGHGFAEGWNFGPKEEDCKPVEWILNQMVEYWGSHASWELDVSMNPYEANFLKLDCTKAADRLFWQPKWDLKKTLKLIVDWHRNYLDGKDLKEACLNEIQKYST